MTGSRHVHLEGMGVTGCLLAVQLSDLGYEVTWHDTDEEKVAWRACTGAIYPGGGTSEWGARDDLCHTWWLQEYRWRSPLHHWMEEADYVYCTKAHPHGGKADGNVIEQTAHWPRPLRVSSLPSFHLNAQEMVPAVRAQFEYQRMLPGERPPAGSQLVVAHGFGKRLDRAYWGWTKLVRLRYEQLPEFSEGRRPCLYFRPSRVEMAYAFPVPNTPYWYAGSSLIQQDRHKLKELEVQPKYERWLDQIYRFGGGVFQVVEETEECLQGWRPAASREDDRGVTRRSDGAIVVRPLWNSGVRHFPAQLDGVLKLLRERR